MSKTVYLELPVTEEQVRELEIGDIVYIKGKLFTSRDRAHARAVDQIKEEKTLPMDYASGAMWHCGPIMRQDHEGAWHVEVAGATTSSRFSERATYLTRQLGLRVIIGKGTMEQEVVDAMCEIGCIFLTLTGGCAALYAEQIAEVETVYWHDLDMVDAVWVMHTQQMGPLIVGIDAHGNSIYAQKRPAVQKKIDEYYEEKGIDRFYDYAYLPKKTPGRSEPF